MVTLSARTARRCRVEGLGGSSTVTPKEKESSSSGHFERTGSAEECARGQFERTGYSQACSNDPLERPGGSAARASSLFERTAGSEGCPSGYFEHPGVSEAHLSGQYEAYAVTAGVFERPVEQQRRICGNCRCFRAPSGAEYAYMR